MTGLEVIGVAGGIGSGKTVFARLLAERLGAAVVSFGDYVRGEAAQRGLDGDRETLQLLGERLIAELGWPVFTAAVLAPWDRQTHLVVEGVRHVDAVSAIGAAVAPHMFRLVFLEADAALRTARIAARDSGADGRLAKHDSHSTERDVHSKLRSLADVVLEARLPPEELARQVEAALRRE